MEGMVDRLAGMLGEQSLFRVTGLGWWRNFFELDHMEKNIDQCGRKYVLKVDFVLSQCMVVSKMEHVDGSAVQHV